LTIDTRQKPAAPTATTVSSDLEDEDIDMGFNAADALDAPSEVVQESLESESPQKATESVLTESVDNVIPHAPDDENVAALLVLMDQEAPGLLEPTQPATQYSPRTPLIEP